MKLFLVTVKAIRLKSDSLVSKTCTLKTLTCISLQQINTGWFIRVLITYWLFYQALKIVIITETFHMLLLYICIKGTQNFPYFEEYKSKYFLSIYLTLSWRRPLSYRNQSIDLQSKSMDCFLYDNGLCHERVNASRWLSIKLFWKLYEQFINQLSLRKFSSTKKLSFGLFSVAMKGISWKLEGNLSPPFESWSKL